MKKRLVIITLTAILICLGLFFISNSGCNAIKCLSIKDERSYKPVQVYEQSDYSYRALLKNKNIQLRVEHISDFTADQADFGIQSQTTRIKGLFENGTSPYPGEISSVISCGERYKPTYSTITKNGVEMHYFSAFVNDRLVFGACTLDQAAYRDTMIMFYCKNQKRLYQIEVIMATDEYVKSSEEYYKIVDSVTCKQ